MHDKLFPSLQSVTRLSSCLLDKHIFISLTILSLNEHVLAGPAIEVSIGCSNAGIVQVFSIQFLLNAAENAA